MLAVVAPLAKWFGAVAKGAAQLRVRIGCADVVNFNAHCVKTECENGARHLTTAAKC